MWNKAGEAESLKSVIVNMGMKTSITEHDTWRCEEIWSPVLSCYIMCAPLLVKQEPWRQVQFLRSFSHLVIHRLFQGHRYNLTCNFLLSQHPWVLLKLIQSNSEMPAGYSLLCIPSLPMWWVFCGHKTSGDLEKLCFQMYSSPSQLVLWAARSRL